MEEKKELENKEAGDVITTVKLSFRKKQIRKFIFYCDKIMFFCISIIMTWLCAKLVYSPEMQKQMTMPLNEGIFIFGLILGIWLLWSFLFLVFIDKGDFDKEKQK
jgi:hypothetical protein